MLETLDVVGHCLMLLGYGFIAGVFILVVLVAFARVMREVVALFKRED